MTDYTPTPDEKRNGWTARTLRIYHEEREIANAAVVLTKSPRKPQWANSRYNPLRRRYE